MDEVSGFAKVTQFFRENKVVAGIVGIGLVLLLAGVWQYVKPEPPNVEIIQAEDETVENAKLFVDVAGAVENPGVYELAEGSRIGNALAEAGGLSASADRVWVSRYVNLAAPVGDGTKIYIPEEGESGVSAVGGVESVGGGEIAGLNTGSGININTASASELDTLWGIGEARAGDIIANRPYQSVEELLTKAGIPKNVYDKIKDQVSVY